MTPAPPETAQVVELNDADGLRLTLLDIGATWWSLQVPVVGERHPREVLPGGATPQAHLANTAYLGSTVGRVANRIAGARLARAAQSWALHAQPGSAHQLHGGPDGYDRRRWALRWARPDAACFALHSPALDQGFPGALDAEVQVHLPGGGVVEQRFLARCSEPSPVCLTNHAYFNLDGAMQDARQQVLQVEARSYAPVDAELIPLGSLAPVDGSALDFRQARRIADRGEGVLDHGLLLSADCATLKRPAATLIAADSRLRMRLYSTMPALQVYTGQHLLGQPARDGGTLAAFAGVALEPEWLPDSAHHPEWPQPDLWLQPGQAWQHTLRFVFDSADRPESA